MAAYYPWWRGRCFDMGHDAARIGRAAGGGRGQPRQCGPRMLNDVSDVDEEASPASSTALVVGHLLEVEGSGKEGDEERGGNRWRRRMWRWLRAQRSALKLALSAQDDAWTFHLRRLFGARQFSILSLIFALVDPALNVLTPALAIMSNPQRALYVPTSQSSDSPSSPSPSTSAFRPARTPRRSRLSFVQPQASFLRKPAEPQDLRGSGGDEESRYLLPSARAQSATPSSMSSISEKARTPHFVPLEVLISYRSSSSHQTLSCGGPTSRTRSRTTRYTTQAATPPVITSALAAALRIMGYPISAHFANVPIRAIILHVNATGQLPNIGNFGLIDLDTPKEMYNINGYADPSQALQLVFSDEFEMDGRTFYPGDDPYWEAVDLHYWQTGDMEWYDPSAIITRNGALEINLTQVADPSTNHNLSYMSGMITTWNKIGGTEGAYVGQVSQSAQWAPYNAGYHWDNTSANLIIADPTLSILNEYAGSVYQQATSVVTNTNQTCYQLIDECYAVHGFEYVPGYDNAYITWITNNQVAWTLNSGGMAADPETEISARPIPQEPMYILANLGMSPAFGYVDLEHLTFPATMRIDWVRVYQHPDSINIGCDPPDFPTQAYINAYSEAYTNPLLTTWVDDYKQTIPKNSLVDEC
ncbi:beta-glucan synthesis-associated protein-domain-containing protein [Mycena galopus ATCC 62051]|nr:beta-glucan synthesis-associated protein-domain-containing protein [Mycena galopus ATCC 62051]